MAFLIGHMGGIVSWGSDLWFLSSTASATPHGVVPVPERDHDHGIDNVHGLTMSQALSDQRLGRGVAYARPPVACTRPPVVCTVRRIACAVPAGSVRGTASRVHGTANRVRGTGR